MRIPFLFILITLAAACSPAKSENYVLVAKSNATRESGSSKVYVKNSSIQKIGHGTFSFQYRISMTDDKDFISKIYGKDEVHCESKSARNISIVTRHVSGHEERRDNYGIWEYSQPKSVSRKMVDYVCSMSKTD